MRARAPQFFAICVRCLVITTRGLYVAFWACLLAMEATYMLVTESRHRARLGARYEGPLEGWK